MDTARQELDPRAIPVEGQFVRSIVQALHESQIRMLQDLLDVMARSRVRWWTGIEGIGPRKAAAVEERLRVLGLLPTDDASDLNDSHEACGHELIAIPGLAPLERLQLPELLDGSRGRFRAPPLTCLLKADTDIDAVKAWLSRFSSNAHTQRAYRREVERFLLWCVFEAGVPLSGVSVEHAIAYRDFLSNPQPAAKWCAPRNRKRWDPTWRPFEGPLSHSAIRQAVHILGGLFEFLVGSAYLTGNPFRGLPTPPTVEPKVRVRRRALSAPELAYVREQIDTSTRRGRRLAAIFDLLYATGLRLAGVAVARWQNLELVEYEARVRGWMLHLSVKRGKDLSVPVPDSVIKRLVDHAIDRGLPAQPNQAWTNWGPAALIGRVSDPGEVKDEPPGDPQEGLKLLRLARIVKGHFEDCAARAQQDGDAAMAAKLLHASTHWMRHTHATHAHHAGMNTVILRDNLGHASLASTTIYLDDDERLRMRAAFDFWKKTGG